MLGQGLLVSMLVAVEGWHGKDPAVRASLLRVLRERTAEAGFALVAVLDAGSRDAERDGAGLGIILRAVVRGGGEADLLTQAYDQNRKRWVDLLAAIEGEGYPASTFDILRDYPVPRPSKADNDDE
jgi:hypothetical protein